MIQSEKITGETVKALRQTITATLPEHFGLPEANVHYAKGSFVMAFPLKITQATEAPVRLTGPLP